MTVGHDFWGKKRTSLKPRPSNFLLLYCSTNNRVMVWHELWCQHRMQSDCRAMLLEYYCGDHRSCNNAELLSFSWAQNSGLGELQNFPDYQCTEVKKGEINYSELLLFQASLGYFWMPRTLRWILYCTGVAAAMPKRRYFRAFLAVLSLFY